jgi:hypothetical protein
MFNPNPAFLAMQKLKSGPKGFTVGVKFICNLGSICNPKMLKVGPKFFWVLTPSVKWALVVTFCLPSSYRIGYQGETKTQLRFIHN